MAIPRQLPNAITIVRILCAPVFLWMLLADQGGDGPLRWWAGVLFIVAIVILRGQGWVDPVVFYVALVVSVMASLAVDVVVLLRLRVPSASDVTLPTDPDEGDRRA